MIRSTRLRHPAVSSPSVRTLRRRRSLTGRCFPASRLNHIDVGPHNLGPSARLLSSFVAPGRRRRPLPPRMNPSGESSAAEDYVHVSSPEVAAPSSDAELHSSPPEAFESAHEGSDHQQVEWSVGRGAAAEEKRVLPEELAQSVVTLECESSAEGGICDVYLVGTAHVSQESCREVQAIISYLKPQVVFLELCSGRISILTPQNLQVPTVSEMIDMWKKKKMNAFGILYSWFLAKVADNLEVFPGSEFRVAFEEARDYGAKVILGDRPVHITLKRTWGKMTLWYRAKFLYYILSQTIFLPSPDELNEMLKKMNDVDMVTLVIQEMSKAFPTMMETLLHERDMYMSSKLLNVASQHSSVVAVVGKGHLPGIKKHWKQPIEVSHLLEIPTKSRRITANRTLASIALVVTGVAVASGLYLLAKKR